MEGLFPIFVVAIVKRRRDEEPPAGGGGGHQTHRLEVPPKKRGVGRKRRYLAIL